MEHDELFNMLL